jgi:hypothetical protein
VIALLRPFDKLTAAQFGGMDPKSTSLSHANSMMGTIWSFRALYTTRYEFWFAHLLAVCAFRVIFDLESGLVQVDTFAKACQALYELSDRFNIARDTMGAIRSALQKHNLQIPQYATLQQGPEFEVSMPSVMRQTVVPTSSSSADGQQQSHSSPIRHMKISDIVDMEDRTVGID